jgi:hypothetical protein
VAYALDRLSVVSRYFLRGIEAFEARSVWGAFHGANRSYHALSLQVLFSAIPHLLSRSVKLLFGMLLVLILMGSKIRPRYAGSNVF